MNRQIYTFFAIVIGITGCIRDTEVPPVSRIEVFDYETPRHITRDNDGFALFRDTDTNVTIHFTTFDKGSQLYLNGGARIEFAGDGTCPYFLSLGDSIGPSLPFSSSVSVDYQSPSLSCQMTDTTFVGVRVTFAEQPYREQFGWLRIVKILEGYWIADRFVWQTVNHKPIAVGQNE